MIPVLAGAFLAGLMGSPHCVAMCGPFAAACAQPRGGLALWHLGRVTGYALLGALAGIFGAAIPGPPWVPAALAVGFLFWFAGALAGVLPEFRWGLPGITRVGGSMVARRGLGYRFAFGVVNGFLPCVLVYSALSLPMSLAQPVPGAMAMIAFGLGTLPALSLAAVGLRHFTARSLAGRRILAAVVLAAGLWSIAMRSGALSGGHQHGANATHPSEGR
jgi:sulfite exporter TauE/SafE